jgi:hypothetical protein
MSFLLFTVETLNPYRSKVKISNFFVWLIEKLIIRGKEAKYSYKLNKKNEIKMVEIKEFNSKNEVISVN